LSNLSERNEKICLNCNAVVNGRFCHICGQENIEPREPFRHMLAHFVFDLFHFDGKFFSTMKSLLLKPGFLSQEHLKGRRADYLHPIRLYIFTSAFFFLFYFSFNSNKVAVKTDSSKQDTTYNELVNFDKSYSSIREYDSIQALLPKKEKDGFIIAKLTRQNLVLKEKYPDGKELWSKLIDVFTHQFPKMLFVSLPIFAFILFLLYARKDQYYYSDHIVYTLHLYSTFFIIIFLVMCLNIAFAAIGLYDYGKGNGNNYLTGFISSGFSACLLLFYWYKSLRKFYHQSRTKTILKFSLLLMINVIIFSLLFLFFILFSFMII